MNAKKLSLTLCLALLACLPLSAQSDQPQVTYTFTTVNYPGDTFTQLLGINNANVIAGYHGVAVNKGFTYNLGTKTFTNENFPGSAQTQVIAINNKGKTAGFYIDAAGITHGFFAKGGVFSKIDFPGQPFNQTLGANDVGQTVGYYSTKADGSGPDHAYINDNIGNVFELFVIQGSVSAQAVGVNNLGNVCGFTVDKAGVNHGWLRVQGTFTILDFPGSTGTQALGVNNKGIVVGSYTDATGNSHGFTYNSVTPAWTSIDDPNGIGTTVANGINDAGDLVGFSGTSPLNNGWVAIAH